MKNFKIEKFNDDIENNVLQANNLAKEILVMGRNKLFVNFRFLESAFSRLKIEQVTDSSELLKIYNETKNNKKNNEIFSTDGEKIRYNFVNVLNHYKNDKNMIQRSYLHIILHCIYRHLFVGKIVNQACWDLACDIAVENIINELNIKDLEVKNQIIQEDIINELKENIKVLTAEKIYKYLLEKDLSDEEYENLRDAFVKDSHQDWYTSREIVENGSKNKVKSQDDDFYKSEHLTSKNIPDKNSIEKDEFDDFENDENEEFEENLKNKEDNFSNKTKNDNNNQKLNEKESQKNTFENSKEEKQNNKKNDDNKELKDNLLKNINDKNSKENSSSQNYFLANLKNNESIINDWKDIAEKVAVDLETFSKNYGNKSGSLIQNLKAINREKCDYKNFLKKFASFGEVTKINDDEFDYIFYTYGLKLYENMPLIEPLEYKEVKKIKEFVIAIDTSGSVKGEIVQRFIEKTYNILKGTENFFSKINIHIIQCDTKIQEDKKISNQEEFNDYIKNMKLKGFGGTDFRPVFEYVEELVKNKEFKNLKGLIYFTDGDGKYPLNTPSYKTAFVFVEDDKFYDYKVPSWAMKVVLTNDEIKEF